MIEKFNDLPVIEYANVYASELDQIRKLYAKDPALAGELAISMIELALTGDYSSDDDMIEIIMKGNEHTGEKTYRKALEKMEANRRKKVDDQQLDLIAEMLSKGYTQAKISRETGIGKQTVSNRVALIRKDFPELYDLFRHLDK